MADQLPLAQTETFWRYLGRWLKTATAGTWDRLGLFSLVAGVLLWAWNKFAPVSFRQFAGILRVSPEVAMADLVWEIPLALGGLALAWRFVRAPYEIHLAQDKHILALQNEVTQRRKSHAIHEAMLRHRSDAIRLLNHRVDTNDEYAIWKNAWRAFETALLEDMSQLGCSASEIHGAQSKNIGAMGVVQIGKDSQRPAQTKGLLLVQIKHIEHVAEIHDTSKPV